MKKLDTNKNKLILYLGILLADIVSELIFKQGIFRFILYFIIIFFTLVLIKKKKIKFYDFFIAPIFLFIKAIIEYLLYLSIFDILKYEYFVIILEAVSILFVVLFNNVFINIYKKIKKLWTGKNKFYFRYTILIIFNTSILFILYNLIKIKEVL